MVLRNDEFMCWVVIIVLFSVCVVILFWVESWCYKEGILIMMLVGVFIRLMFYFLFFIGCKIYFDVLVLISRVFFGVLRDFKLLSRGFKLKFIISRFVFSLVCLVLVIVLIVGWKGCCIFLFLIFRLIGVIKILLGVNCMLVLK